MEKCNYCEQKIPEKKEQEGKKGFCKDYPKHVQIRTKQVERLTYKIEAKRDITKIFGHKWEKQRKRHG